MNVRLGLGPLEPHAHGVEVVLAHEQDRQPPQARQVQALVELALVDRAFAEEAHREGGTPLHPVAERQSHGERQTAADDGVAAVEPGLAIEKVHRAAAAATAALEPAVHLGHQHGHRDAAGDRLAVLAIGGDHRILGPDGLHDPDRDRLLAVVEVQKAPDLLRLVQLEALLLEPADADHLLEQMEIVRVVEVDLGHRSSLSSVERSPSGSPSSRALSRRRMILPLRVLGRFSRKSISLGATAAPRRFRA